MRSKQPIILGITGGIACGKTEAGLILAAEGFRVLDSDELAHELMGKGMPVYRKVMEYFGRGILSGDGEIDRKQLRRIIFDDPAAREALNAMVHPAVIAAAREWIGICRSARQDAAVLVPLLFEAGWTDGWDAVVCVTAPEDQVYRRLEARGLARAEASKWIAAQMPQAEKAAKADFTVENSGTLNVLKNRITDLVKKIRDEKKDES